MISKVNFGNFLVNETRLDTGKVANSQACKTAH